MPYNNYQGLLQVDLHFPKISMLKSYPQHLRWDLTWRQGLYRGNQVKMKPLVYTLIQYACHSYKGKYGHRHIQREDDVRIKEDSCLQGKEKGLE